MRPPLPRPPWHFFVVLLVLAAVALGWGARITAPGGWDRVQHDVGQGLAGIFLALLVGGGFVRWWQEREWRARTRFGALDLLDQAMRQTAITAASALHVLDAPASITAIDSAFRLPWDEQRDDAARALGERARRHLRNPLGGHRTASTDEKVNHLIASIQRREERAAAVGRDMEARIDALRGLVLELGPYVEGDPIVLVNAGVELRRRVLELIGPVPGERARRNVDAGTAALHVLEVDIRLARLLGAEDTRLRCRLTAAERERLSLGAEALERERMQEQEAAAERELQAILEETDRAIESFDASARDVIQSINAILASNPSPAERQELQQQLDRVKGILEQDNEGELVDGTEATLTAIAKAPASSSCTRTRQLERITNQPTEGPDG